jgi:hypothetical protein
MLEKVMQFVLVAAFLAGLLALNLMAASMGGSEVGRYSIACENYICAVLDTATGQIVRVYARTFAGRYKENKP